nr:reverse transcriptase domain-containing protein [Tanacetum cinerariifolium]
MFPITQIDTFYNGLTLRHRDTINADAGGTFMKRRPEECYDLIENMTAHHNNWDTLTQRIVTTNEFTNFMKANDAILKNMQTNMTSLTNSNLELKNMVGQFMKINTASSLGSRTLPGNTITNPKEDLKGITTRSGTAYQRPTIPTTSSSLSPVVERKTEATKDMVHPTNNGSTEDVQPLVFQTGSLILNSEPVVAPIIEPVASPVSALKPYQRPSIPPGRSRRTNHLMPLFVWNQLSLPELTPTLMNLELANRSISRPIGVTEDVYVKVGKFHFLADFVVIDFDADPRVPLILGRSFLKTERALIDVFKDELTLRVGKEAITFNLKQTSRYSGNYNDMSTNRIDVIDMACEEYSQEVLGFSNVIMSGNPTPYYDPIVSTTSPTLTPFENSNFLLDEVDTFLAIEDDPTSPGVDQSNVDTEGDILLLEAFLNDDLSLPPPNLRNYLPQVRKELKICEVKSDKSSIDEPLMVELNNLPLRLEYAFLEGDDKLPVVIAKDLSVEEKTALITVLKSHNDFAIDAVLGQCQEKYFRTIHYASKTMTEAESNYTITEKEMVYAFEKFWSYLIMNKSIVYTDHFTLKYLFAKKDSKAILLRWVLLLQEFTFKVIDTKGAENLAADHLSQLENPHQNVLEPKVINESFPIETLNLVSSRGNSSTPWFADFTNYHTGNFVLKGMSSQQKNKFFKDVKHYFWDDPFFSKSVRIKSFEGVYMARKPLTLLRLATMGPQGDITARITQPRRCLIEDSIGLPFTVIPKT